MTMISETSCNEEMKRHTIHGKLFAIIGKNLIIRFAIYNWRHNKEGLGKTSRK